jgi:predicted cobalt transporter CbtA
MLNARTFLVRGLLAGLIAGFVAFGVAYVVGEPSVNAAIAIEEAGSTAGHTHDHSDQSGTDQSGTDQSGTDQPATAGQPAGDEAGHQTEVPRSLQSTLGLMTGTVVAGATLGGLVGMISALALGRLGRLGPRASTLSVAALGFVGVYLIPTLGYPPNPPAVGHAETIGYRTALYFTLLAISLIAMVTAVLVGHRLAGRIGGWHAFLASAAGYLAICLIAIALMPAYDEVPADFPANVLFSFRRASLITQLALWATIGIVLAEFVGRIARTASADAEPTPVSVP